MVRDAVVRDAPGIAYVHTRTWQRAYEHVFGAERLASLVEERRAEQWHERLVNPEARRHTLVVEDEGSVVGFAEVGPTHDPDEDAELVGEDYAIYVLPETWGEGIGRALMGEVLSRLRTERFREAILWVLEDNPRTRRYYELAGWRADGGRKEDTILGTAVRQIRYRVSLHPTG